MLLWKWQFAESDLIDGCILLLRMYKKKILCRKGGFEQHSCAISLGESDQVRLNDCTLLKSDALHLLNIVSSQEVWLNVSVVATEEDASPNPRK